MGGNETYQRGNVFPVHLRSGSCSFPLQETNVEIFLFELKSYLNLILIDVKSYWLYIQIIMIRISWLMLSSFKIITLYSWLTKREFSRYQESMPIHFFLPFIDLIKNHYLFNRSCNFKKNKKYVFSISSEERKNDYFMLYNVNHSIKNELYRINNRKLVNVNYNSYFVICYLNR